MHNITYKELREHINNMDPDRLEDNVTVYLDRQEDYCPVTDVLINDLDDEILDEGHTYLVIGA